jgi:HSP20 family protein
VEETDKEVRVRAEIPGVKPDDLEISISGNALVISGEKKESQEKREKGYFYQERRYGSFYREVPLPTAVDEDNVQAEYKDGILSVILKKSKEALPKKIQVKAK